MGKKMEGISRPSVRRVCPSVACVGQAVAGALDWHIWYEPKKVVSLLFEDIGMWSCE